MMKERIEIVQMVKIRCGECRSYMVGSGGCGHATSDSGL